MRIEDLGLRIEDCEGWNLELRCMRCTQTDTHTDTLTHRHTGHTDRSTYLKMDLKSDFFDFFQTICFWKAESLCFKNL